MTQIILTVISQMQTKQRKKHSKVQKWLCYYPISSAEFYVKHDSQLQ